MGLIFDHYHQFFLMAVLLCFSGLFSGCETAFFSLRTQGLNQIRRAGGPVSGAILFLHSRLTEFLLTVLFCNLTVNILFFATSTVIATKIMKTYGTGPSVLFALGCLITIITVGEVVPKMIAAQARVFFCRLMALPMLVMHKLLTPVRGLLGGFLRLAERAAGFAPASPALKAEELRMLIEISREEGVLSSSEHELISEVMELPEIRVKEIMTPRVDLVTLNTGADAAELFELVRASGHPKIPVRDPQQDELVGWLDAREVFAAGGQGPITPFLRPSLFVSELDRADQVLRQFRARKVNFAIVVDERGATAGIVTLADVLAELFGELEEEDGLPGEPIREVGENAYLLAGGVSVREWRHAFGVARELPKTATVGGLVMALLGRAPQKGDRVYLGNIRMEVTAVRKRRITEILLTLENREADDGFTEIQPAG